MDERRTPTICPGLLYHDAPAAIEWLCAAFGFVPRTVIPAGEGRILHAHLTLGERGGVMLSSAEGYAMPDFCRSPRELGVGTVEIIVVIDDADSHCATAMAAGADILIAVEDKPYGGRGYSCRDLEGHVWAFGTYDPWADTGLG